MAAKQAKEKNTPVAAPKKEVLHRQFTGIVVSDKNDKTIVVRVDNVKKHPKYQKRYVVSQNYKVHDEKNAHHIGDKVVFIECRPLSKDKRWRVVA